MTTPTNPINDFSPFLPTTWNVPEEEDRRIEWMGTTLSSMSDVINDKVIGMYVQDFEQFGGSKFFYDTTTKLRNGYRFLLRVASFPNTGTLTIPLPIVVNGQFIVSQVWGSASRPTTAINAGNGDYFSFYSQGDSRITFVMTDLNVVITTTADMTLFSGFIVVDYIKDGI